MPRNPGGKCAYSPLYMHTSPAVSCLVPRNPGGKCAYSRYTCILPPSFPVWFHEIQGGSVHILAIHAYFPRRFLSGSTKSRGKCAYSRYTCILPPPFPVWFHEIQGGSVHILAIHAYFPRRFLSDTPKSRGKCAYSPLYMHTSHGLGVQKCPVF